MADEHIVLVSDDAERCSAIATALRAAGYPVASMAWDEQAQQWIKVQRPSVVVLCLMDTGGPEPDIAAQLESAAETKHIPVLLCSTSGQDRALQTMVQHAVGASGPVQASSMTPDEVLAKVKVLLAKP